MGMIQQ